ncbi:hypothetical protein BDF20DRAFT_573965 [Mycotypha africana]|uniref:uncharacterized protein n=1 Tax=Mycotypha africana TaxID=64632 RepID=UPI0023008E89|nr:uncharacterized protein BDF20DRAFT_573965 [Mycotypha africana]KAI8977549.1 hypothetical protein BDF20DRAFT_573965 [Mycotypha africana]
MVYILEYAKSDRSNCNGAKDLCPSRDRTIGKGDIRLGVEVAQFHGVIYRHWTCATPTVIENMKKSAGSVENIVGFDKLREEDQERVRRAWDLGEIPENERPEPYVQKEEDEEEEATAADNNRDNEDHDDDNQQKNGKESKPVKEEHGKENHGR